MMHDFLVAFLVRAGMPDDALKDALAPTLVHCLVGAGECDVDVTTIATTLRDRYLSCGWYDFDCDIASHGLSARTLVDVDDFARRLGFRHAGGRFYVHANPDAITDQWFLDDGIARIGAHSAMLVERASLDGVPTPSDVPGDAVCALGRVGAYVDADGSVTLGCRRRWESLPSLISERLSDYVSLREAMVLGYGIEDEDEAARRAMRRRIFDDCADAHDMELALVGARPSL